MRLPGAAFLLLANLVCGDTEQPSLTESLLTRYSRYLEAMGEPSLCSKERKSGPDTYRLLVFGTYRKPIVVRFERGPRSAVVVKEAENHNILENRHLKLKQQIFIADSGWSDLQKAIEKAGFWRLPTPTEEYVSDADIILLEGVKDGRYHVVERAGLSDGSLREACRLMLRLGGLANDWIS